MSAPEPGEKCEDCGREKSILPDHLSRISCIANLRADLDAAKAALAEAVGIMWEWLDDKASLDRIMGLATEDLRDRGKAFLARIERGKP